MFRYGVLVVLLLAATPLARADDVQAMLERDRYEHVEEFRLGGATVRSYSAPDASASVGWYYFLVRAADDDAWTYAYRLDRHAIDGSIVRLDLHQVSAAAPTRDADLSRVAGVRMGASDDEDAAARALVEAAESAAPDWHDYTRHLAQAYRADVEESHRAWRRVVTSLEHARERHPQHLGILRDLVVAYTQLSAFEHDSTRGANLSRLLPVRIAELETIGGNTETERRTLGQARAMYYLRCGLYPLADALIRELSDDAGLETVHRAVAALGQSAFADRERFTVTGEVGTYDVRAVATLGDPPAGELLHDELYFLPTLEGMSEPVGRVWYVLSRQALDASPRFYLYGCSGRSRALLMMYGKERPPYETVRGDVERVMTRALTHRARPDDDAKRTRWIAGAIGVAFLLFAIVLGRRLGWFRSSTGRREAA